MKFALVSDLHLEFAPIKLPNTGADVLLLAGDIVPVALLSEHRTDKKARLVAGWADQFIEESLSQYKQVYHILGNHEYYHGYWDTAIVDFRDFWDKKAKQVQILNNQAVVLEDGLRLFGGTLWTDFDNGHPVLMNAAGAGLNDYHLIYRTDSSVYGGKPRLIPETTWEEHCTSKDLLKAYLESYPKDKWLVMTHHAPSWNSVEEKYKKDKLSYCFASHLDSFIEKYPQIHTWAHGHTHSSHDYKIGNSRILCNPRGYSGPTNPNKQENTSFNSNLVFEI